MLAGPDYKEYGLLYNKYNKLCTFFQFAFIENWGSSKLYEPILVVTNLSGHMLKDSIFHNVRNLSVIRAKFIIKFVRFAYCSTG